MNSIVGIINSYCVKDKRYYGILSIFDFLNTGILSGNPAFNIFHQVFLA